MRSHSDVPSGAMQARADGDHGAHSTTTRVLIPIDATERSRWALQRVLAEHRAGTAVEVHLLFVAEPITSWEVLRFRTQAEIAKFQAERAGWLLEDAATPLRAAGIKVSAHFRAGDIAFEIVDAAEQLACARIVLPLPRPRWCGVLARDIVREVLQRARASRVETVDERGAPRSARP